MSLQAPEPRGSVADDAGGDSAQHHLAAPPALHVAFDVAGPADEALGDTAAVTALLDRLLHHAHVLKCGPRSWRTRVRTTLPTEDPVK